MKYLPKDKLDLERMPREYVANVIFTICEDDFKKWVDDIIEERNEKMAVEGNKMISLDPELAKIFHASTSVSGKCNLFLLVLSNFSLSFLFKAHKGIGANLLKPSAKRRRTKKKMQEDKLMAAKLQVEVESKVATYDSMQTKVEVMESQVKEATKVHAQL